MGILITSALIRGILKKIIKHDIGYKDIYFEVDSHRIGLEFRTIERKHLSVKYKSLILTNHQG